MKDTEIIEALQNRLAVTAGRHLYGVLGAYPALDVFVAKLQQAKTPEGQPFPALLSVNRGILDAIPDEEFRELVEHEARRPEPTRAHVAQAFERFLRASLASSEVLVLAQMELVFAYSIELSVLRALARDDQRVILLLPGKREGGRVIVYPGASQTTYRLPINLIADNHLWEIT